MTRERSSEPSGVPKKSRSPRRFPGVALILIALVAAGASWWLLRPRHNEPAPQYAAVEPSSAPSAAETPYPQESAASEVTAEPLGSPETPAESASPAPPYSTAAPSPTGVPPSNPNGPKLALIVDDCGQWIDTERAFVALGVPLTLSVLPDVPYTATIAREAAGAGKGVMLHLPMETVSGLNPGPGKVTTEMSDAQITAQVEADLAQVPLARGVNNHEGSKASADARVMRDVIGVLAKRGNLFFVDSRTSSESLGERTAHEGGVPTAGRDVFLDNQATVAYTEAQLREAAAVARRTGSAIAIGHPHPTTLAAVRAMIPELQASGIQFVLVGDLVSPAQR
jgi:polysaccharide deacetylase 2 family uncharacterized protein YibQ